MVVGFSLYIKRFDRYLKFMSLNTESISFFLYCLLFDGRLIGYRGISVLFLSFFLPYKKSILLHNEIGEIMKKIMGIVVVVLVVFCAMNKTTASLIPKEALRFRVLANSNSEYDQQTKLKVRDVLQQELYDLLEDTRSVEEARSRVEAHMGQFETEVQTVLDQEKAPYGYKLDFGIHHFPEKSYKGVTYEEGDYESLVVTLGSGEGNNWWCVLFPPLCLLEAEETDRSEVEYKFFFQEIIEKYFK